MNHSTESVPVTCDAHAACLVCADIERAHEDKLQLCREIEAIADALPSVDWLLCLHVANRLVPLLREAHRYEEEEVFPVFERTDGYEPMARIASVRRLKAEHIEDECAAQDLTEVLLEIGHGGSIENPEALGFMLRAFFETIRRHIAFEREHVLPVVAGHKAD